MNVLISSAGRRGALVRLFQDALRPTGGRVLCTDAGVTSAACRLSDGWTQVPRCTSPEFIDSLLDYCRAESIGLIIPTIDTELPILAAHRERFLKAGIRINVSDPAAIAIACDKQATHNFFRQHGLPTVTHYDAAVVPPRTAYPLIIKPRAGSASIGVQKVVDEEEYLFFIRRTKDPVVQSVATGPEYTVNFFIARRGRCVTAVPHRRIETRGGEVSKGITERQPALESIAQRLAATLPGGWGAWCFQAFLTESGPVLIELNARFGGGYPLAHAAGARFPQWLLDDAAGQPLPTTCDWTPGLVMTRWDDAVFYREGAGT